MNLNEVKLIGRLTRDPEVKALPSGQKVANFSVATNYTYKDKAGEKVENVSYHNCKMFGKGAEIFGQYAKKGQIVYVSGRLEYREWEKDGVKRNATEIMVDNFQFGPKAGTGGSDTSSSKSGGDDGYSEFAEIPEGIKAEDIPF
mgnify:CR=1 FL=1